MQRLLSVLAIVAVATTSVATTTAPSPSNAAQVPLDPGNRTIADQLIATERAFSAMAQQAGVTAAFATYMADEARMLRPGRMCQGKADCMQAFQDWPAGDTLEWHAEESAAASGGDLGWTWGPWVLTKRAADGAKTVRTGRFVTIWRKQHDGTWKFIYDGGDADPPPKPDAK